MNIGIIKLLKNVKRLVVIASGGDSDLLGFAAISELLKLFDIKVGFAAVPWGRPGTVNNFGPLAYNRAPLSGQDIGHTMLLDDNCITLGETPLARFARATGSPVYSIDINRGVQGLHQGIEEVVKHMAAELIILTDSGGDILGTGLEAGALSPLLEAAILSALNSVVDIPTVVSVLGIGCDGELKNEEYERGLTAAMADGAYLGAFGIVPECHDLHDRLAAEIPSEASVLPFQVARGLRGEYSIRGGRRSVELKPYATIVWFISPSFLFDRNVSAKKITLTRSLNEIQEVFHRLGKFTELDHVQLCQELVRRGLPIPDGP